MKQVSDTFSRGLPGELSQNVSARPNQREHVDTRPVSRAFQQPAPLPSTSSRI